MSKLNFFVIAKSDLVIRIRIRIEIKSWIRIRIETNKDQQLCKKNKKV
jgi:hypothetical protein